MKIQKGIVKYRDRNDIVCTYGITDDGVQYYFLNEDDSKKLTNGNRIVTTALVEAIDPMAKCSNIGVIDNDGSVVIACGNRSIKEIDDELLLVETAQPTSLSVVEAINLKNDPLSAAKLVSTPATIKDKLNNYIGSEGKYLFNDQFSEATVCDINGNNLLNGESYSFVVSANNRLYLSKNVADSDIVEFDLADRTIVNNNMIDVSTAVVDQNVVEGALSSVEIAPEEVLEVTGGTVDNNDSLNNSIPYNEDLSVIDYSGLDGIISSDSTNVEGTEEVVDYTDGITTEESSSETVVDETVTNDLKSFANGSPSDDTGFVVPVDETDSINTLDETISSVDTSVPFAEENSVVDEFAIPIVPSLGDDKVAEDGIVEENIPSEEVVDENVAPISNSENNVIETKEVEFNENVMSHDVTHINPTDVAMTVDRDNSGIVDSDERKNGYNDFNFNSSIDELSRHEFPTSYDLPMSRGYSGMSDSLGDSFDNIGYSSYGAGSENIMGDVVKSMSELMKQNKDQRVLINQYREQMNLLNDKFKDQSMRMDNLVGKLRALDEFNTRLESKNQVLESRVRDQEKIIANQDRELKSLRPQLNSKQDLVKLLADAQSLIGNDYSYEDGAKYYGRVA